MSYANLMRLVLTGRARQMRIEYIAQKAIHNFKEQIIMGINQRLGDKKTFDRTFENGANDPDHEIHETNSGLHKDDPQFEIYMQDVADSMG